MSEEYEKFNERFETVEQALKYIADSRAEEEFENRRRRVEWNKNIEEMRQMQSNTQTQLDHITKIVRFLVEESEKHNDKLEQAGNTLIRK